MSEPEFKRVEEIFHHAADLPPDEREGFLNRACGGDGALRRAVLDLLRHDAENAETGDFLVSPVTRAAERLRPSAASPEPAEMPKIAGFELLDVIGRGGMGVVYRARQIGLGRIVAIKTLSPDAFGSADQRERFRAEAELLARIQQPNIMPIFDFGETEGRPYFVMEYVPGGNLGQRLMGRPQDPISSARLIATLARAM
jgi:serine/threonine protein kinase